MSKVGGKREGESVGECAHIDVINHTTGCNKETEGKIWKRENTKEGGTNKSK